jgi:hypothetical protein
MVVNTLAGTTNIPGIIEGLTQMAKREGFMYY